VTNTYWFPESRSGQADKLVLLAIFIISRRFASYSSGLPPGNVI